MAQRLRRALEQRGGEQFFEGRLGGFDVVGGSEADELLDLVDQLELGRLREVGEGG